MTGSGPFTSRTALVCDARKISLWIIYSCFAYIMKLRVELVKVLWFFYNHLQWTMLVVFLSGFRLRQGTDRRRVGYLPKASRNADTWWNHLRPVNSNSANGRDDISYCMIQLSKKINSKTKRLIWSTMRPKKILFQSVSEPISFRDSSLIQNFEMQQKLDFDISKDLKQWSDF